jgi:hypothetical protein
MMDYFPGELTVLQGQDRTKNANIDILTNNLIIKWSFMGLGLGRLRTAQGNEGDRGGFVRGSTRLRPDGFKTISNTFRRLI